MITRIQANVARLSMVDVFTPEGDAAIVVTVHTDDTATVSENPRGNYRRYPLAELVPSRDLLRLQS